MAPSLRRLTTCVIVAFTGVKLPSTKASRLDIRWTPWFGYQGHEAGFAEAPPHPRRAREVLLSRS
jgi:hypothetical protein